LTSGQEISDVLSQFRHLLQNLKEYFRHPALLPSLSLSLLYLTVLSFSGQMVTYLLAAGYTSTYIGYIRSVSVIVEMSATWLAPVAMTKLGPIRGGIWFLSWQTICLTVAVGLFLIERTPVWAASYLVAGVIASRIGLWGFDLCAQIIIQEVRSPCEMLFKVLC
jgi:iron-regulated transporter 1